MGTFTGCSLMIEDTLARLVYWSPHKMHQLALKGPFKQNRTGTLANIIRARNDLFGGTVQGATAIDPRCATDPNLDHKDLYRTHYEATRLAIKRALNDEPDIDELITNRNSIRHDTYDPGA